MVKIIDDVSRTFNEFLLLPRLTRKEHVPSNVSLRADIKRYSIQEDKDGKEVRKCLNVPFVSAAMQAVSGHELAIALARKGGCSFIYCSQPIDKQAEMVRKVKEHKAGFVVSDSNLPPCAKLKDAVELRNRTGHSTIAITEGGKANTKLYGLLTSKDFWEFKDDLEQPVRDYCTPVESLVLGHQGITLQEATELLWKNKKECLPIVDNEGNLVSLVFRRDYFDHKSNPDELCDEHKRLFVGAAINTRDYTERAKALVDAGADVLCIDSSDGYSEWQKETALYLRKRFGDIIIGGGNVVTKEGFRYLVEEAQVDFVKVGIGGGSICITREQKGIGRGQASALLEVCKARDEYCKKTGIYVPICSDGGINNDTHIILALAMGADFVMMGKYFAMTEESPTRKVIFKGRTYKPYWGEGSNRARNWERYKEGELGGMEFEEGVDAYVPFSGTLSDKVDITVAKIKAAMCNIGVCDLKELHKEAILTRVSEMTLVEGGTSSVEHLDRIEVQDR
ncbi:MAG: IMP dehydrogenase [Candidatus Dadabacteria bacterium]|nr:MAG: IMP dehydrogenase [Candidatus Dadabacteria bacterium]